MSPCLVFAALCGPAPEPPPVSVQPTVELRLTSVDEGDAKLLEHALRSELSDRLLQDGYRVVPGGRTASVVIWVHLGPEGVRVQAQGVEERVETIAAGDPDVVALEVLQLTTALVDEVQPLEPVQRPAVALEIEGQSDDPELRERLQVGLLERGYALTRTPMRGDRRLCVVAAGPAVGVHTTAGDRACEHGAGMGEAAVTAATAGTVELRRVLLLDEATAALDEQARAELEIAEAATVEAAAPTVPIIVEPLERPIPGPARGSAHDEAPRVDRATSLAVTLHGGFVGRGGEVDGALGLRLRAGRRRGLGGGLDLTVVPSAAEGVRVVETMPTALFDWSLGFGRHGIAGFGALAGLHVHAYRQDGPAGARDVRLAPSLATTVRLGWLGARGLVAFGGLRAGWSGGRWIHVLDGVQTWERSGLLVGLELGVGWDFALRGRT